MAKLHRPISSFDEEFCEKIDDDIVIEDVSCSKYPRKNYKIKFEEQKELLEQAIFKEFEEDGWDIEKEEETGIIIVDNGVMRVKFHTFEKVYECGYFTLDPAMVDAELHLRIHKLICLWGWFDE